MDQQVPDQAESGATPDVQPDVGSTGVPAVDEVLRRVSQLADRPVAEHVEVFERAHEQLRRALDARPEAARAGSDDQGA